MELNVYILYGPEEFPDLKKRIRNHFGVYTGVKPVKIFHEETINAGEDIRQQRMDFLRKAHIVILIISPELQPFLDKEQVLKETMLERMAAGELLILPVPYRPALTNHWFYHKLQHLLPLENPVTSWNNQDEAWVRVQKYFEEVLQMYREMCSRQSVQFDVWKTMLSGFNFSSQFKYLEEIHPTRKKSLFHVFFIQGGAESGHNLLMRRIRRRIHSDAKAFIHPVNLGESLAADQIGHRVSAFFGNEPYSQEFFIRRLVDALHTAPRSIVFDQVENSFQCESVAGFLKEMNEACHRLSFPELPEHPCCIFIMNRNYAPSRQLTLNYTPDGNHLMNIVHLPPIEPVSAQELEDWVDEQLILGQITPVDRIKLKDKLPIKEGPEINNAVMPVLKRITDVFCETMDLTEAIFDRYLATLQ